MEKTIRNDQTLCPKNYSFKVSTIAGHQRGRQLPSVPTVIRNDNSCSKLWTIDGHQWGRPLPSMPIVLRRDNSYSSTLNPNLRTHRQPSRSENFSTAATLSSIHSTDSKGPLRSLWETPLYDSVCDSDSVGDTTTDERKKFLCRCLTISIICFINFIFVTALVIYFMTFPNVNTHMKTLSDSMPVPKEMEMTPNQKQNHTLENIHGSKIILGEFTISNKMYSSALRNRSSLGFQSLASDVCQSMDEMFLRSPLKTIYNFTKVYDFGESDSKGVVVKFRIGLNIALLTAAQEVGLTFINALERTLDRLLTGNLGIDIKTIKLTALSNSNNSDSTASLVSNSVPEKNQSSSISTDSLPVIDRIAPHEELAKPDPEHNKPEKTCNDCEQNEICLLQVKASVPICAKIKDLRDPMGCGGWCSGHKELCRYVGAQTYQCVDDSGKTINR